MKRTVIVVAALGLVVGACGGSDDDAGDVPAAATDEAGDTSSEATESDATVSTAMESTDSNDSSSEAESSDDAGATVADGTNAGATGSIRSLDEIPEVCREQMATFLREVEPIVSEVDWETATFSDFEAIGPEFDAKSQELDNASREAGCNDLNFADDNEFDLMIEFAEQEAPGVVQYLTFLATMSGITSSTGTGDASDAGFGSCGEGIDFLQGLMDTYDSFAAVPATELLRFMQLTALYPTCSPDELAFFDSDEVNTFLSE